MRLKGKKILLGVTGGIAAYKVAFLIRYLKKQEAEVKVIMTPASFDFVTPLTLSTLSQNEVLSNFKSENGSWNNHVELGLWADLLLIAPLTANTMAKMVAGICDNLLLATYLSAKCPVMVAPAMDLDMYAHPTVRRNLKQLELDQVTIIPAENGELASGLSGLGRMAEPETILEHLDTFFSPKDLTGKKVLITAGPTYEQMDPVRFIGNHSSGKMGAAIAEECFRRGAEVILIMGPSKVSTLESIKRVNVVSAQQMFDAVKDAYQKCDYCILSAAVADFKPAVVEDKKIKKSKGLPTLTFEENPDILAYLGQHKKDFKLIGFALETNDEVENAKRKIKHKNLDLIVLNSLKDKGAGFGGDTNKITLINKKNEIVSFDLKSKLEVASDIVDAMTKL